MTKKIEEEVIPSTPGFELTPRIKLLQKIEKLFQWMDDNCENLELDGNNTFQKFKYVKGAQYRTMLRKGCREVGLIFKQNDSTVNPLESGEANRVMIMHCMQFLIDPDTGEFEQYITAVAGQDGTDKHLEKAKTQGIKSFVKTNFLISDGDADDNEGDAAYSSAKGNTAPPKPVALPQEDLDKLLDLIIKVREKTNDPTYATGYEAKIKDKSIIARELKMATHKAEKELEK